MSVQPGSFPSNLPGPYRYTQRLPLGPWNLMVNGRVYVLDIQEISRGGRVRAEIGSGTIEDASWDGVGTAMMAGKLSFIRVTNDVRQQFEGWLFQYNEEDPLWRMAGTIEHTTGPEARSGWYATLPRRS